MKTCTVFLISAFTFFAPSLVQSYPLFNATYEIWAKRGAASTGTPLFNITEFPEPHKRAAAQAAPHWVAYWDEWVSGQNGLPSVSSIKGHNVFILSFLLQSGPADQVTAWTQLDASTRASMKSAYANAGIKLMVSAFGSTDAPTSNGADPVSTANSMASFVKKWGFDGIDVDYEDFNAIEQVRADGSAEAWLISFTKTLRAALPSGQYLITHAPVAPWFSPIYTAGAYRKVHSSVGSLIDWYNVQFYNQGSSEYTSCNGLLTASSKAWPKTSVFEIHSSAGVDLSKIVIGKPAAAGDADNGYVSPSTLSTCLKTAKNQGWTAGAMFWEYPHASASLIKTVRSASWAV